MRYIGVDAHQHYLHITEFGADGPPSSYRVALTPEGLEEFKQRLGPDAEVVLEASTNSFSIHDQLAPHAARVVVAHPAQTRGAAAYHLKNDRSDSKILAQLLRTGFVRPVWVPSPSQRALRNMVEYRGVLSKLHAATLHRLHALLRQELISPPVARLESKTARAFLQALAFSQPLHTLLAASLARLREGVAGELEQLDAALGDACAGSQAARLLMTVPGIGPVLAAVILSQIGDISRFATPGKLAAYAGLVPCVVQSGKRSFTRGISRRSRTLLRWALTQAAIHAGRRPGPLQRFHARLVARCPRLVARVACARKLATVIWHMLRTGHPYQPGLPPPSSPLPGTERPRCGDGS